jgi:hypothetical protein
MALELMSIVNCSKIGVSRKCPDGVFKLSLGVLKPTVSNAAEGTGNLHKTGIDTGIGGADECV